MIYHMISTKNNRPILVDKSSEVFFNLFIVNKVEVFLPAC